MQENPELLPARIAGGSGAQTARETPSTGDRPGIEIEKIKPGMSKEDWTECARRFPGWPLKHCGVGSKK